MKLMHVKSPHLLNSPLTCSDLVLVRSNWACLSCSECDRKFNVRLAQLHTGHRCYEVAHNGSEEWISAFKFAEFNTFVNRIYKGLMGA